MAEIYSRSGIASDTGHPSAAQGEGVVSITGSGQVCFFAKATHADCSAFGWTLYIQPASVSDEGPPRSWYTDASTRAAMQGTVDTSGGIVDTGLVLPVDAPPGSRAYLRISSVTGGGSAAVDLCVTRRA